MVEALVLILVTLTAVAAFVVGADMAVALFAAPAVMARRFATNLGVWVGGAMLAAGLYALVSFSGLILIPESLLPAFGLDPWLGLQGLSFTGTYAVLTCGLAIALVLWPRSRHRRMLCRRGLVEAKTSAWGAKTGVSAAGCRAAGVRVVAAINTAKAND